VKYGETSRITMDKIRLNPLTKYHDIITIPYPPNEEVHPVRGLEDNFSSKQMLILRVRHVFPWKNNGFP